MTVAIILAGGVGARMGKSVPKQFVEIKGKPILAYTLESFQKHPYIDAICVVCVAGWEDCIRRYADAYGITKLGFIVPGGDTVQESIRNGVFRLEEICAPEDIAVVHDGIRPLVDSSVLTDVIEKCRQYGNAVSSMPYNEQIFWADDEKSTIRYIPRETLRRVSTPQAYRFSLLDEKYHEAFEKKIGIYGSAYTNTMMVDLGVRLYFAKGSDRNIKLTTPDDLKIFEAMLNYE